MAYFIIIFLVYLVLLVDWAGLLHYPSLPRHSLLQWALFRGGGAITSPSIKPSPLKALKAKPTPGQGIVKYIFKCIQFLIGI